MARRRASVPRNDKEVEDVLLGGLSELKVNGHWGVKAEEAYAWLDGNPLARVAAQISRSPELRVICLRCGAYGYWEQAKKYPCLKWKSGSHEYDHPYFIDTKIVAAFLPLYKEMTGE